LAVSSFDSCAIADHLSKHLQPVTGGNCVIVGSNVRQITEYLASVFSSCSFVIESDPLKVLTKPVGSDHSWDLICFVDAFSEDTGLQRKQILSKVRNALTRRVLHLEMETTGSNQWQITDSLALGYRRIDTGEFKQSAWSLYEFNIANYKITPGWLNADHWSNPEHWDQYRW